MVTVFDQAGFDARLEWGIAGARVLAGACRVIVVVDVLSFTTAIEVAAGRGAVVFPVPGPTRVSSGSPGRAAPARAARWRAGAARRR